jgi:hypothetical protein
VPDSAFRFAWGIGFMLILISCMPMKTPGPQKLGRFVTTLHAGTEAFKLGQTIELSFEVQNTSDAPQKFCRYMTPFEGFNGNILEVLGPGGERISYRGVMKKRGKPRPEDYLTLLAGEARSVAFDLDKPYQLALPGAYRIRFIGNASMNKLPNSSEVTIQVTE